MRDTKHLRPPVIFANIVPSFVLLTSTRCRIFEKGGEITKDTLKKARLGTYRQLADTKKSKKGGRQKKEIYATQQ